MKKLVSFALVLVLLVGCMSALTSCNTFVMGTYSYTDPIFETTTTYEFTPLNKVTKTAPKLLGTETVSGTYKVQESTDNPGTYLITFTWDGQEAAEKPVSFTKGSENGVDYIEIGGLKLTKK